MIDFDNQTQLHIAIDRLEQILHYLGGGDVELLCVDSQTMRAINQEHRGKDESTDVLSFPLAHEVATIPLGTIVVCAEAIMHAAAEFGHSTDDEAALLFLHGLLHLQGYDHESDNGEQRAKEAAVVAHFGLPQSLIVRAEK
ncbi:MAG: rRNA maturation RNase YbeY [Helicobacter sp.]|nr:rRNA maturation RNase YbeY [Helicobacter sp.]